jgi:hypothetical protein
VWLKTTAQENIHERERERHGTWERVVGLFRLLLWVMVDLLVASLLVWVGARNFTGKQGGWRKIESKWFRWVVTTLKELIEVEQIFFLTRGQWVYLINMVLELSLLSSGYHVEWEKTEALYGEFVCLNYTMETII